MQKFIRTWLLSGGILLACGIAWGDVVPVPSGDNRAFVSAESAGSNEADPSAVRPETPSAPQRPEKSGDSTAPYPVSVEAVPVGFERRVPQSLDELREMQEHLTALVPRISECTVNLRVGGAQGSGVLVSADGLILTAAHVTGRPGQRVSIIMADGNRYNGRTLGRNRILDASIVKIESDRKNWPHCAMAEEAAKPGDWCLTLAHPGGFQAERGLVLRLGRVILENRWMIQSDCELVGGDSGGPLFGADGKVIGINTRIGESTDLNFHVPILVYTRDWQRFLDSEDFRTHSGAYLGLSGIVKQGAEGMEVTEVFPGQPADRAGIKTGDIIVTFQARKITSMQQLVELVGEEQPGMSVKLSLLRDGEQVDVTVRLGMRWD